MKKFPKIKYPNDPETDGLLNGDVVVTEKFDGANFRFKIDDDGISIGTRNIVYEDPDDENFPNAFKHARKWLRDLPQDVKDYIHGAGVFFGEAMHLHSLDYENIDWQTPAKGSPHVPLDDPQPNVVLFDWWQDGSWADWEDFEKLCDVLGLPKTPVLARGPGESLKEDDAFQIPDKSAFGGPPEGIVVRRQDGSIRAKKVSTDFKEKNAQAFNDPSKAQSDAAEFLAMFLTEGRIRDVAHDLVDEGDYDALKMEMMQDLPQAVLQDIMDEEGWNLLNNEYGFECEFDDDFKSSVRSKASSRCAKVLKRTVNQI